MPKGFKVLSEKNLIFYVEFSVNQLYQSDNKSAHVNIVPKLFSLMVPNKELSVHFANGTELTDERKRRKVLNQNKAPAAGKLSYSRHL